MRRSPALATLGLLLLFFLSAPLVSASNDAVEVQINADGSSSGPPAPSLPNLISSVRSTPGPSSSAPVADSRGEAVPTLKLNLSPAELDFQQLLMDQIARDAVATTRARAVKRPAGLINLTAEELGAHDGSDADRPIYLSIRRKLYDVTDGVRYYGLEGRYHYLVGREVGRALATGCFESTGLTYDVRGLSEEALATIDAWQSFYKDKYRFAGYLKGKKIGKDSPIPDDACQEKEKYNGRPDV